MSKTEQAIISKLMDEYGCIGQDFIDTFLYNINDLYKNNKNNNEKINKLKEFFQKVDINNFYMCIQKIREEEKNLKVNRFVNMKKKHKRNIQDKLNQIQNILCVFDKNSNNPIKINACEPKSDK